MRAGFACRGREKCTWVSAKAHLLLPPQVLLLLPERAMRLELPRVLQSVANLLKGRLQSTR